MSKSAEKPPILTLLSIAAQREKESMVVALRARGFDKIGPPEMRLVGELKVRGPSSIQALADATGTTKQFCAREVKKLEAKGYVSLEPSPDDKRVTLVVLGPAGRRFTAAAHDVKVEHDASIARRLGAANARALRQLLEELVASNERAAK
ncbi:Transcriptional regulator, MarR family [Labilithrix luteola]|uniref:Transcriptional regulator, MarR family n=1 Tax=Labilithrix luteola TaxID=1391654 RepID=A0A0K1PPX3_9BACT|nr:MarR family winged helix-turn-helix transcriptional regulator [Labilithrix luteola]AKU95431.1 Transcriptional regulator, MarR family [Labilithrix luteola]